MVILLPFMHPALCSQCLLPGIRLFNPGVKSADDRGVLRPGSHAASDMDADSLFFLPENLPMDSRTADRYVRDALTFGQGFKKPRDISSFAAGGVEDFYTGTSMSILFDLTAMEAGQTADRVKAQEESLGKAQALLLFAWTFEQVQAEAVALDTRFQEGYAKLRADLGLNEPDEASDLSAEDALELAAAGAVYSSEAADNVRRDIIAGWRNIFEAMSAFLPQQAQVAAFAPEIAADIEEFGLNPVCASGHPWEGMDVTMVSAPGWKLSGRKSLPRDKPWLATERTMFLLAAKVDGSGEM